MPHKNKEDERAWRRRWWAALSPERKAEKAGVANKRATIIRRYLDAYKLRVGCVDCGYNGHHAALHFDHVRGSKTINVCNAKSIAQADGEIQKCEVRCANCHEQRVLACDDLLAALQQGGR